MCTRFTTLYLYKEKKNRSLVVNILNNIYKILKKWSLMAFSINHFLISQNITQYVKLSKI